jgi:hypothetical protein
MDAMDAKLLLKVIDEIAEKVVAEIYPEVLKSIDKEVIVKEVSLKVSERVLASIFTPSKDTK